MGHSFLHCDGGDSCGCNLEPHSLRETPSGGYEILCRKGIPIPQDEHLMDLMLRRSKALQGSPQEWLVGCDGVVTEALLVLWARESLYGQDDTEWWLRAANYEGTEVVFNRRISTHPPTRGNILLGLKQLRAAGCSFDASMGALIDSL